MTVNKEIFITSYFKFLNAFSERINNMNDEDFSEMMGMVNRNIEYFENPVDIGPYTRQLLAQLGRRPNE
jgi:hypothetical protein